MPSASSSRGITSDPAGMANPIAPTLPPGISDPDVHLYVRADGAPGGTGVKIPAGFHAVTVTEKSVSVASP